MALPDDFLALARKVSNWGRWGDDDQRGTLNLIDDAAVRRAAECIRTGKSFSLAIPLSKDGPQLGNIPGRTNPQRSMLTLHFQMGKDPDSIKFSDDAVTMPLQCATHWDALAHVSYAGRMYNGRPPESVTDAGAADLGAERIGVIATRGVLLDVARVKECDRIEGGVAITPEDLDAAEQLAGTRVEPGDVILIRTGHMQLLHDGRREDYTVGSAPGPGMACAEWFRERDVAAVATDNISFEVWPLERKGLVFPLHLLDLVEIGLLQGQNWNLEELAADCAADGIYQFFLEASPEPFVGSLGSPVNPVAIK